MVVVCVDVESSVSRKQECVSVFLLSWNVHSCWECVLMLTVVLFFGKVCCRLKCVFLIGMCLFCEVCCGEQEYVFKAEKYAVGKSFGHWQEFFWLFAGVYVVCRSML